ncbi:MAG: DUF4340 domain-containing protein [Candidatus Latescibacter sp.]|nr:DUF4340 domain-containing protein [Candidatus Latescibacter sp.]
MKNKSTLIMGGVFLLLVVIFLLTSLHPKEVTQGATPLFPGEKPVFDKFEINNPKSGLIVLVKQGDSWKMTKPTEYKAGKQAIDQLLESLTSIMVDGVVSSEVSEQKRLGVDDSTGIDLKAYSGGKQVLDVLIGDYTPDLSHTYARMKNSKDIALWRGVFSRIAIREPDDWRDKSIYSFNEGDITSIKAVDAKQTRDLTLSDSTWVYKENGKDKPVDQFKVRQLVTAIASLSCDSFAADEDIPRAGTIKPDVRVSFKIRNGDTHTFDVWNPGKDTNKNTYLFRKENGDMLFRFYEYRGAFLPVSYDKLKL